MALRAIWVALVALGALLFRRREAEGAIPPTPGLAATPFPTPTFPEPKRDVLEVSPADAPPPARFPGIPYWHLFTKWADRYGLDPYEVAAIAWQETGGKFNPDAVGDEGRSLGLMQVLSDPDPRTGRLRRWINGRPEFNALTKREMLSDPDKQIDYGAWIHAQNKTLARGNLKHVSIYNSWSARLSSESGPFPTVPHNYAARVLAKANEYRGAA